MSPPPNIGQPACRAKHANRRHSNTNKASTSVHKRDTPSQFRPAPDRNPSLSRPATRHTSHRPSEGSESTILGVCHDDRSFENASSVTLQDVFPWHELVDLDNHTQKLPSTIVPALLQGVSNVSPSRSSVDGERGVPREADEDLGNSGDVPRYSATQKGKWKAQTDGDVTPVSRSVKPSSPQSHFNDINNDWVIHTRPILQDYADRQTSLPLGRRLEVTIDEPPKFILGAIQLLVNRDQKGCTDRARQLGPQLIENFVDIDRWAKDYFRSRHGTRFLDSDVSALLTIVINNFYEGQVQLIDRLVEFALENMHFCGRSSLGIQDFAFGFDFKMSQDLPFYVETSSHIREPLPIPAVDVRPTSEPVVTPEPVVTHSGRHVKLTERARAASEQARANANGRRNKEKFSFQQKDEETTRSSFAPARQEKSSTWPSAQRTVAAPSPTTKHRPTRPSNLGLPPILPISSRTTLSHPGISSKSEAAASTAESPKLSGSRGSNPTVDPPPRLRIILPSPGSPVSTVPKSTLTKTNSSKSQTNLSAGATETTNKERRAPRSGVARPRGPRNERDRSRGRERGRTSLITSTGCSTARLHTADNRTGDDDPPTAQSTPAGALLPPPADPGHPQGKKRKLDDCED